MDNFQLNEYHIQALLQLGVLSNPITHPDKGACLLTLSAEGNLSAIPLPESNQKKKSYSKKKKSGKVLAK